MWLFKPQPASRAQCPQRRPTSSTLPKVAAYTVVALVCAWAATNRISFHSRRRWPFLFPRHYGADHGAVRFGNHLGRTLRRQRSEGLPIAGLQLHPRPLGVFQGGGAARTGSQLKAVMLLEAFRCPNKGMLAAKVRQHPIQPARTPTGRDSQPFRQKTPIASGIGTPNPLPHLHQAKHTPPLQCFFFTTADGRLLLFYFPTHTLLGPYGPLAHAGMGQPPHLLNQQALHFIGRSLRVIP